MYFVTVIVAHHITSRCCCVAGCDCLSISLFISTTLLSPPLGEKKKKADLPEQQHVTTEINLQPYFLSYGVTV